MNKANDKRPVDTDVFTGRKFLNQHLKEEKLALSLAVLAGVFSTVLMLVQWVSFSFVSESVIVNDETITDQMLLLVLLLISVVGRVFLTRLQTLLSQKASVNIRKSIRHKMLAHWRLSSPVYLKNTSTGAFATQFVEDVEAMDGYFSRYWPQQALAIISPLLILCVIAYLNWLCALLLLISAPLIPLFMILVGIGAEQLNQKYSTMRQRLSGHFLDRVSNLSNIKLLGAQQSVFEEVESNSDQYRNIIMKTLKVAFLSSTVLEFFTSVAIAALAIYIGFSLYGAITWGPADGITLFTGLTILILAPEFFQPLRNLSQYYHDRASALGSANNLVESFAIDGNSLKPEQMKSEQEKTAGAISKSAEVDLVKQPDAKLSLKLCNLSIGYESRLTRKLSVELKIGSMLVISGHSGSGKTTLLNTIAGFVPALGGEVVIAPMLNKGVSNNRESSNQIAYLPQKAWIKNDTIYENLAALAPKASKTDMLQALKQLGLEEELDLKRLGLDTPIGEHGQGLSGGQMQRIAFARVLLNPTPIVLLDEPTAKLDFISKELIVAALKLLKPRRILVISSHDPLLISMSDVHINLNKAES